MRRKGVVLAALLLAAVVTSTASAQGYVLRYKEAVGTLHRYSVSFAGQGQVSAMGMVIPVNMTGAVTYTQTIVSENPTADTIDLRVEMSAPQLNVTMQGQSAMPVPMGAQTFTLTMTRSGKVLNVTGLITQPTAGLPGMQGFDPSQFMGQMTSAGFPTYPVSVGGTWSDTSTIQTGVGTITINATSTLEAIETYQGYRCARIRTHYNGPLNLAGGMLAALGVSMTGQLNGTSLSYFALDEGFEVGSQNQSQTQMGMEGAVGGLGGEEGFGQTVAVSATMQMTADVKLQQ